MTISTHFDSLEAFLEPIRHSKDPHGAWCKYSPNVFAIGAKACTQSLDEFLGQASTYQGLEKTIEAIETVAQGLAVAIPSLPTLQRKRMYAHHGTQVHVHRALRGATKVWHGSTPVLNVRRARTATLMIPCWFPWRMSEQEIFYTLAASCAYALVLQQSGLSLELVAFAPAVHVWEGHDNVLTITIKPLGGAWNMQALALLAQPAFLRRGIFRLYETMTPTHGALYMDHYGTLMYPSAYPRLLTEHISWSAPQAVLFGADTHSRIGSLEAARAFVQTKAQHAPEIA